MLAEVAINQVVLPGRIGGRLQRIILGVNSNPSYLLDATSEDMAADSSLFEQDIYRTHHFLLTWRFPLHTPRKPSENRASRLH